MSKTQSSGLTGFERADAETLHDYRDALQTLRTQDYCAPRHYPWDYWEQRARACGLTEDEALLGREVMREAHQHQWEPVLKRLCGWEDEGAMMIELALAVPEIADFIWRKLLATDGGRGSHNPATGEWISWR
jgi:hypothetical protein